MSKKSISNKAFLVLLFGTIIMVLLSCTPEPCEDCYTFTYSDGSTEWMCVEYDCADYNY